MFGAFGGALAATSFTFVSAAAQQSDIRNKLGLRKQTIAVKNTRNLKKTDMIHNNLTPHIEVDPETYKVVADGEHLVCEPAKELPMAQRYFLF